MNKSRIKWLIISCVVLVILLAFGFVTNYYSKQKGRVQVNIALPLASDTNNLSLKFNSKSYVVTSLNPIYSLHKGQYVISITKPGYQTFSTSFSLQTGGQIIINTNLQLVSPPPPISSSNISIQSVANLPISITRVNYFYNNIWAVVGVSIGGSDNATMVSEYDPVSMNWKTVLQPGTGFNQSSLYSVPYNVQQYLINNGLASTGN